MFSRFIQLKEIFMTTAQRIISILLFILFAVSYAGGMMILFELSTTAPFIVTGILILATAIALKKVKRAAKLEGAKPDPQGEDLTLLGLLKTMGYSTLTFAAIIVSFEISIVVGVAFIELLVFSFMIGMVLLFVFGRIEIQTRDELTNKTA